MSPAERSYEAIVVGSGIGGTSAATLLAKAGVQVLLVERMDGPGGLAHSFERGPYSIDPAIHGMFDEAIFDALLRYLDVRDQCTFLPMDIYYTVAKPDFRLDVPFGLEEMVSAYVGAFPESERALRDFFDLCHEVHDEARKVPPRLGLREIGELARLNPRTFKYGRSTTTPLLEEYFPDEPRVRAALGAPAMLLGASPSVLSFLTYAQMIIANATSGGFFCQGGAQRIIDAMVDSFVRDGGELVLGREVDRILTDDGRVTGVRLDGGEEIAAQVVVSNSAAPHTFANLVGHDRLPERFVKRLHRMRHSLSAVSLYAATKLDLPKHGGKGQFVAYYRSWEESEWYPRVLEGDPWASVIVAPTGVDPSLAPDGEHLVLVAAFVPYDIGTPWDQVRERYLEQCLEDVEAMFPGFRDEMTFAECALPPALVDFSLNTEGACYGWENSPTQTGSRRLAQDTPIEGLLLAGHWTRPGSSFTRATISGINACTLGLRQLGREDGADRFDFPGLPPV